MTPKELREMRARLVAEARARINEIKDDTTSERAAELEAQADQGLAEVAELDKKIERQEALEAAERREREFAERAREGNRPGMPNGESDPAKRSDDEPELTYRDVFVDAIRHGVENLTPAARAVFMRAQSSEARAAVESRALSVGTPSAGGYTVPQGFSGEIDMALAMWGPMLDRDSGARQYDTSTGNPIPWPTVDYTAVRGGLHTEGNAVTDDGGNDPVIGQKVLNAYIYDSEIVKVSLELLQDSAFSIEGLLTELFGESLGRTVNQVLTTGDGSNKPHGIVTAASAGKTAASETALAADELIDLFHSVDPAYRTSPACMWQFNDSTLAAIRKLKDGQGNYLWQMGDVRSGEPDTFLGKRYKVNQAMASVAESAVPIIFGDHSRYVVRRVQGTQMVPFREKFMNSLQVGFMAFMRLDGELLTPQR